MGRERRQTPDGCSLHRNEEPVITHVCATVGIGSYTWMYLTRYHINCQACLLTRARRCLSCWCDQATATREHVDWCFLAASSTTSLTRNCAFSTRSLPQTSVSSLHLVDRQRPAERRPVWEHDELTYLHAAAAAVRLSVTRCKMLFDAVNSSSRALCVFFSVDYNTSHHMSARPPGCSSTRLHQST